MPSKPRLISASQLNTFGDCRRHWWFQRIARLSDGPPQAHFTFGTVLHAVCERWLTADENGRVPHVHDEHGHAGAIEDGPLAGQYCGEPVELYPEGWETVEERDGTKASVTPTEAKLIKRLVEEAIEEGILIREPGTQVERELRVPVIEGVDLIGYADVFRPAGRFREQPRIEDHKTYGKGSVRYLMRDDPDSPNSITKNQQLKTYAWAVSELDGWDGPVDVRHHQFPKFKGREVTAAEGTLTALEIENHGEHLREQAREIKKTSHIEKWEDVPGPSDAGKCSRWYGKECPFAGICSHRETIDAYRERSERALENHRAQGRLDLPLPKPKKRGKTRESVMSLFDKVKAEKARKSAAPAVRKSPIKAPSINPETEADAPVQQAEASAPSGGAPWATASCTACKGRGVTSKGRGCPMCDGKAKRAKRPTSMSYMLEVQDDGTVIATAKDGKEEALRAADYPTVWAENGEVPEVASELPILEAAQEAAQEPETPEEEPEVAEEPEAQEEPVEEPVEEPEPAPEKKPRRKRKAKAKAEPAPEPAPEPAAGEPLTLLVGAVPLRPLPGRKVATSRELLECWGAELAKEMGAESYWDLDPFKRRDRLAAKASAIAEASADLLVIHPGSLANDDTGSFIQALMADARVVTFLSGS